MSSKCRKLFGALFLVASAFITTASAQGDRKNRPEPLVIQEQGSFAVGGTVINNPGKFDPYRPTPEGQTFRGDHATCFISSRRRPVSFPW